MFKTAPAPTDEMLAQIEELESERLARMQAKSASFERCDTDGFLSQWADGISANKAAEQIEILKNGGCAQFVVLCNAAGEVVASKLYTFAHPVCSWLSVRKWRLPDELAEIAGRKWLPDGENSRIQKKLGYHEEMWWFPAHAIIAGSGTGLSGCANAYVTSAKNKE